jgi:hypothetical protein
MFRTTAMTTANVYPWFGDSSGLAVDGQPCSAQPSQTEANNGEATVDSIRSA